MKKGGMGRVNLWYADDAATHRAIRAKVLRYLATYEISTKLSSGGSSGSKAPHQPDPMLRQKIEKMAVRVTTKYYKGKGYVIKSREPEKIGWDLDAIHVLPHLNRRLEVKGLSGGDIIVELTPNEFAKLNEHKHSYEVCIVTNALTEPTLAIFAYSEAAQAWVDGQKRVLKIQEMTGARCFVIGGD